MTTKNDVHSHDSESSKKKELFDLSTFILKPISEVVTAIGKLYLFPLRMSDLEAFSALSATELVERTRAFVPCIASLSPEYELKHAWVGITSDQASQLSVEEVEAIAEAFVTSNGVRSAKKRGKDHTLIVRATGEPATAYLDRLLRIEAEEYEKQFTTPHAKFLKSTHSIFDQVRKASQTLGDTRLQFERLTQASSLPSDLPSSIEIKSLHLNSDMAEHSAKLERERAEDREIVRLIGQMTSQSAKTLQVLAESASTMLEALDRRDEEAKRTTKLQLWIAVSSVAVSALLALGSFLQDLYNNKSGDEWQRQALQELKVANTRSSKFEVENELLRKQLAVLNSILGVEAKTAPSTRTPTQNETVKN